MIKDATITVRVGADLKQRIERRAAREHRSVSAQIAHELEMALQGEAPRAARAGSFMGRYKGTKVPKDTDFLEVRDVLWGKLPRST